jgi:hypothetical protein
MHASPGVLELTEEDLQEIEEAIDYQWPPDGSILEQQYNVLAHEVVGAALGHIRTKAPHTARADGTCGVDLSWAGAQAAGRALGRRANSATPSEAGRAPPAPGPHALRMRRALSPAGGVLRQWQVEAGVPEKSRQKVRWLSQDSDYFFIETHNNGNPMLCLNVRTLVDGWGLRTLGDGSRSGGGSANGVSENGGEAGAGATAGTAAGAGATGCFGSGGGGGFNSGAGGFGSGIDGSGGAGAGAAGGFRFSAEEAARSPEAGSDGGSGAGASTSSTAGPNDSAAPGARAGSAGGGGSWGTKAEWQSAPVCWVPRDLPCYYLAQHLGSCRAVALDTEHAAGAAGVPAAGQQGGGAAPGASERQLGLLQLAVPPVAEEGYPARIYLIDPLDPRVNSTLGSGGVLRVLLEGEGTVKVVHDARQVGGRLDGSNGRGRGGRLAGAASRRGKRGAREGGHAPGQALPKQLIALTWHPAYHQDMSVLHQQYGVRMAGIIDTQLLAGLNSLASQAAKAAAAAFHCSATGGGAAAAAVAPQPLLRVGLAPLYARYGYPHDNKAAVSARFELNPRWEPSRPAVAAYGAAMRAALGEAMGAAAPDMMRGWICSRRSVLPAF